MNAPSMQQCEVCGADKPNLKGWLCEECGTRNHKGVKKCHKCAASAEKSSEFWMCAACEKNNRIDDLDDNSRCGFCGYDMAPMTMTEAEAIRIQNERSQRLREAQEQFDNISARDADEQFGDETAGASSLPNDLRQVPVASVRKLPDIPNVEPFVPLPLESAHSRIFKKPKPLPPSSAPLGPPGFDWMCREATCGTINAGDEESCSKCGTHINPTEWECCHCGALNHMSRSRCFSCHIIIPVSWVCSSCRTATSIYDHSCRNCGEARPATEPKDPRSVRPPMTTHTGSFRGAGGRRHMVHRQDWNCAECHGVNFASRTSCYQCGAPRGSSDSMASSSAADANACADQATQDFAVSHNNWFCRHCQVSNFRTRTSCWQCGRTSSGSGATSWSADEFAPEFEKEGFQPEADGGISEGQVSVWSKKSDDWTCGKCFSKNFKNRQECHKCGAAKTVAVAPRRAFVRKPVKI